VAALRLLALRRPRTEARARRLDRARGLTHRGPLQKGGQRRALARRAHATAIILRTRLSCHGRGHPSPAAALHARHSGGSCYAANRKPGIMPMLHGIEVDVVDVALQVGFIANGVLPITTLPNSPLASGNLAGAARHVARKPARKSALDQAPAQWKISIALRQRPDGMQVVQQYANCDGLKRIPLLNRHVDAPKPVDMPYQDVTRPVGESDGEEEDAAIDVGTTVSRHVCITASRVGTACKSTPLPTLRAWSINPDGTCRARDGPR
jgi:hypothetical protein